MSHCFRRRGVGQEAPNRPVIESKACNRSVKPHDSLFDIIKKVTCSLNAHHRATEVTSRLGRNRQAEGLAWPLRKMTVLHTDR